MCMNVMRGASRHEVIVEGADLESVVERGIHYRSNLFLGQHKVAHDHVFFAGVLEGGP